MIRKERYRISLLLVAMFAMFGCEHGFLGDNWGFGGSKEGDASLVIAVSAPSDNTRNIGEAGSADVGDKMNSLLALLVNDSDSKIVQRVEITDVSSGFTDATQTEAVVEFGNLAVSSYTTYLIANYESVTTVNWGNYKIGTTVGAGLTDALAGVTLTGNAFPSFASGLPMTAKVSTTLQHGTNTMSAEVERIVARFGINVHNHVLGDDYKVVISHVGLSNFNASNTYLFNHDNDIPEVAKPYRSFFEATNTAVYAENGSISTPFDKYIYETDEDDNAEYRMTIDVAVFDSDKVDPANSPQLTTSNGPDLSNPHTSVQAGKSYLLFNEEYDLYFYMNDSGQLLLGSLDGVTDFNRYLWTFSAQTDATIRNVKTGRYLYRNNRDQLISHETQSTKFTCGTNTGHLYMRYRSGQTRYFISSTDGTTVGFSKRDNNASSNDPDKDSQRWIAYDLTTGLVWKNGSETVTPVGEYAHSNQPLTYIDPYGVVKPLKQIKRNENLQVGVNIFYNPQDGYFNFEVVPWVEETQDNITFN